MENRELSQAEVLTGLEFERLIVLAQARMQTLMEAQGVYVSHLRQVHEVGDGWELRDWAQGFVRSVEEAEESGRAQGQPQTEEAGDGN